MRLIIPHSGIGWMLGLKVTLVPEIKQRSKGGGAGKCFFFNHHQIIVLPLAVYS